MRHPEIANWREFRDSLKREFLRLVPEFVEIPNEIERVKVSYNSQQRFFEITSEALIPLKVPEIWIGLQCFIVSQTRSILYKNSIGWPCHKHVLTLRLSEPKDQKWGLSE